MRTMIQITDIESSEDLSEVFSTLRTYQERSNSAGTSNTCGEERNFSEGIAGLKGICDCHTRKYPPKTKKAASMRKGGPDSTP